RLAPELFTRTGQRFERFQRMGAEAAPNLRQVVRHLRRRQAELRRGAGAGQPLARREVATLEEAQVQGAARSFVLSADRCDGTVEERSNELAAEQLLRVRRYARVGGEKLALGFGEVHGDGLDGAAAFQARLRLLPIHDQTVGAQSDKGAETRALRIEPLE